ncbi:hypothetical protein F5I97DRAFT_1932266 [Phlebopus sp. FC_14]|nr:hypothetical protein F5I97DRAFT_1932266 [Phlebopus sp. FC_14]
MAANSEVESVPTPSIKSLKSRFEQLALESSATAHVLATPKPVHSSALLPADATNARPRTPLGNDEQTNRSPVRDLRTSSSSSDLKPTGSRRAPPPPPPSRGKKPTHSPAVSPLLRPVPAPAALRSPRASPERLSPAMKYADDNNEDESPHLGNVASLRHHFSSVATSPPRPTTPKPPSRPAALTLLNESNVHEPGPPVIPPRHTKPVDRSHIISPTVVQSPDDASLPSLTVDSSPQMGNVASIRNRFSSLNISTPETPKITLKEDHLTSHSEPNILASSPPIVPTRRPPPPIPTSSALFAREDSLELPSSSNSSQHSPFSDDESSVSEISLPPAIPARKPRGSFVNADGGYHQRKYSDGLSSSSESLSGISPPMRPQPPPPRHSRQAPLRPPLRSNGIAAHGDESSASSTPIPSSAPPLPSRRMNVDEGVSGMLSPPPLPARQCTNIPANNGAFEPTSPVGERRPLGNSKLPPPPTRMIGLGDKLPPIRRPHSPSSDEESGEEEDPRMRSAESLPDSSRSSRRPPVVSCFNYSEFKIHLPQSYRQVAVAGPSVVVATHHHIKYYDLSSSDSPAWTSDTKEMGMRDSKVTCMEFRPAAEERDRGRFLWFGTKEGHLFEIDICTGCLTSSKLGAHAHHVTHIFRYARVMITVDDSGKVLIFDPDGGSADDVSLVYTQPRVYRIAEKHEFVKMLGGLLWTSVRTEVNGFGTSSVPVIRIYDVFAPGSIGRSVMPMQHVGAVTSGTLLPSHENHIYLGHEGGFISIWDIATPDGTPLCVEVMKVSASDVLSLEGVNDRLWAGGRNGMISAYDTEHRPWVVTNCWAAHQELPVVKIFVDPYAIEKTERLCVVSIGRDDRLRFWDGLLGNDWIEQELLKRESSFNTFRNINVLIVSWNVDAAKPDALSSDVENISFLQEVLQSVDGPDIIAFGFQELIDLESRKMAAKTVFLGGKKKGEDGKISERVTSSYKRWHDRLMLAVKLAMPVDSPYTVIHTESLVGLFTCMFVKNTERISLKDVAITTIKRGMGGRYGNKGGIVARFVIDDSSICFINCHLAAGQHHVRQRNADIAALLEQNAVFPMSDAIEEPLAYVGGGDGSMVLDHEIVFVNGDMNYRIDQRRDQVITTVQSGDLSSLLVHDQLLKEIKHNRGCRLRSFQEGPLTFAPTYKYDRRSNEYDTSEKKRVPAWCDRILWRSRDPERVVQLNYRRYEANVSDHRPISAGFVVTVKSVRHDTRAREKVLVEAQWMGLQVERLANAREFYVKQALI